MHRPVHRSYRFPIRRHEGPDIGLDFPNRQNQESNPYTTKEPMITPTASRWLGIAIKSDTILLVGVTMKTGTYTKCTFRDQNMSHVTNE